jgi:hypothetical protein
MPTSMNGNTLKRRMRSSTSDETVTTKEAAELLSVDERTIRNYVTRGFLRRLAGERGRTIYVSLRELSALAGSMAQGADLPTTAGNAMRALASATSTEARVARLESILGIDATHLDTDEESVVAFHRECLDLLADYTEVMPASEILNWAYRFAAVTEEYLEALKQYTGEEEPWVPLMDTAQKLYDAAPRHSFYYRKDLESAYGYVASARLHLRQVAYFYIRRTCGARAANKACPEVSTSERDDRIIRLIFMMKK